MGGSTQGYGFFRDTADRDIDLFFLFCVCETQRTAKQKVFTGQNRQRQRDFYIEHNEQRY